MRYLSEDFNIFFNSLSTQDVKNPTLKTINFFERYSNTDIAKRSAAILEKALIMHVEESKTKLHELLGKKSEEVIYFFNKSVRSVYPTALVVKFRSIKELGVALKKFFKDLNNKQVAIFVIAGLLRLMDDLGLPQLKPWTLKTGIAMALKTDIKKSDFKDKMLLIYLSLINGPLKYLAKFLLGISIIVRLPHVIAHAKKVGASFYDKLISFIEEMKDKAAKTGFPRLKSLNWEMLINKIKRHKEKLVPVM